MLTTTTTGHSGNKVKLNNHEHVICLALLIPDWVLLRDQTKMPTNSHPIAIASSELGKVIIDRHSLARWHQDPRLPRSLTLKLDLLIDTLRDRAITERYSLVSDMLYADKNEYDVSISKITTGSIMCDLHQHVIDAAYFIPLGQSSTKRMCNLFSKCLNIRNNNRVFSGKCLKFMEKYNNTYLSVRKLLLTSLLGNYIHVGSQYTAGIVSRGLLYHYLDGNPTAMTTDYNSKEWLFELTKNCGLLIMNVLREFIIYSISIHPALHKLIRINLNFDEFTVITQNNMNKVRFYFNQSILQNNSALVGSFGDPEDSYTKLCRQRIVWDINTILEPSHQLILDITISRPDLNFEKFTRSLLRKCYYCPIPDADDTVFADDNKWVNIEEKEQLAIDSTKPDINDNDNEEEEDIEGDNEEDEAPPKGLQLPSYLSKLTGLSDVINEFASPLTTTKVCLIDFNLYIKPELYNALKELVARFDPIEPRLILRVLPYLEYFGISEEVRSYIELMIYHFEHGTLAENRIELKYKALQYCEPYAYTLLQLIARLSSQAVEHVTWFELPHHLVLAQIEACKSRFPITKGTDYIIPSTFYFRYCPVCLYKYSLIQVFPNKETKHNNYKHTYTYGLLDAKVSYTTNKIYCRRNKVNNRGKCEDQELSYICTLGRIIYFRKKCFMNCPNCGKIMQLDTEQCFYTERGPCCYQCTTELKASPPVYRDLLLKYGISEDEKIVTRKHCFYDDKEIANNKNTYIYPYDIYACKKHHSERMVSFVNDWVTIFGGDTINLLGIDTRLKQAMIQRIQETKKINHDITIAKDMKLLKYQKARYNEGKKR